MSVEPENKWGGFLKNYLHPLRSNEKYSHIIEATKFTRFIFRLGGVDIFDFYALPNNDVKTVISWHGFISWVSFVLIYLWCTYYGTAHRQTVLGALYSTMISYYGEYIDTILSFMLVSYSLLRLSLRRGAVANFLHQIILIDESLRELGVYIEGKRIRMHQLKFFALQLLAGLIKYVGMYTTFGLWNLEIPICKVIHLMFTLHVTLMCMMKYYYVNFIIETRYRYVNEVLESLLHSKDSTTVVITVKEAESTHSLRKKEYRDFEKIYRVSRIFSKIYRVGEMMTRAFGSMIIILILLSFVTIILNTFYLMEATAGGLFSYHVKRYCFFVYYILQTTLFKIFVIYFIVAGCDKVYAETAKTTHIVHELINQQINEQITTAASQLSLQLLHHRHKFTASGLFRLDKSLLLSVAASATTYLVILLQFATDHTIEDISIWSQRHPANDTA